MGKKWPKPEILTVCGACDDGWVYYTVQAAVKDSKGRMSGHEEHRRKMCKVCDGDGRLKLR